jgi:hypothetical protein
MALMMLKAAADRHLRKLAARAGYMPMRQGSGHLSAQPLRTVGPQSRNQESFCATSITSTASGSCFRAFSTCR